MIHSYILKLTQYFYNNIFIKMLLLFTRFSTSTLVLFQLNYLMFYIMQFILFLFFLYIYIMIFSL